MYEEEFILNQEELKFNQAIGNYFCDVKQIMRADDLIDLQSINFKLKENVPKYKKILEETIIKTKKRETKSKSVLIQSQHHECLPDGWEKVVVQRTTGASAGKFDVFFITPTKTKLRSKNEIRRYSERNGITLDLNTFAFTRPKSLLIKDGIKYKTNGYVKCEIKKEIEYEDSNGLDSVTGGISDEDSLNDESVVIESLPSSAVTKTQVVINGISNFENKINKQIDSSNSSINFEFDMNEARVGKKFKIERHINFSAF